MFELPECAILARQMNETLRGKTVARGSLGNSPHKFVWYNRRPAEFGKLTQGKKIGAASSRGRWIFLPLEPGYVLVLGECGGRLLFHKDAADLPKKYHLLVRFTDGTSLSACTQMWGAYELYETGKEQERKYIKGMRTTPTEPAFTFEYFSRLIDSQADEKRSAKGLLTQEQLIPGLGNSIAQDILFRAGLHPRHLVAELDKTGRRRLYDAIKKTVLDAIHKGGRSDELDLFGRPGRYQRLLSAETAGKPCLNCGAILQKIAYLGGACYFCPKCQT